MRRAVIFANGHLPKREAARALIHPDDLLIAADGGSRIALKLGLTPAIIIGDLDSLPAREVKRLETTGVKMEQHPGDKNETDLELALQYAVQKGFTKILVMSALGGRLDQTLANLALLTNPRFTRWDIRLDDGCEQAFFTRRRCLVQGSPGDRVSLLPWGEEVRGVSTRGLRWKLEDETLFAHRTRGVSNELTGRQASIFIQSGLLLIVHRRA